MVAVAKRGNMNQPDKPNPKDAAAAADCRINLAIIPPASLAHEAMALMDGDDKYNAFNWREDKISVMNYVAAAERHLQKFKDRAFANDEDPVSLVHELGHAKASIGIILDALENGTAIDDRPRKGNIAELFERLSTNVRLRRQRREDAKARATANSLLRTLPGSPHRMPPT